MPYRCVVEGFSSVSTDGVWLYFWPRDEALAKLWDRFVRSYRLERRELLYHCTTPKKRRGAYEKGQHQMILDDIVPESEVPDRKKAWIDPTLNNTHLGENHTFASKKLRKSQFCLSYQYDQHNTHCDYRGYVV
ncbi:hypothetical protein CAPTEDRAFT_186085 [Capitella teleta]|uniref:Uncharacterized protein n=1 Tax=Capitella teleta TaxID=283909 RepID=R7V7Z9_CAPTE|nr:hypothetical protein CAPTEDRAFT_186085 [Capitella teleta]|eukprot:ELU11880.1 hypothetical protein CAPTEDRAFT_186085 [Capitella teleta]